jgi:ribosomal protein S18 acetylase RimI-like enzyme
MTEFQIQKADRKDAPLIKDMLHSMVSEMASLGGRRISNQAEDWVRATETIRDRLEQPDYLYLLAVLPQEPGVVAGFIEARIENVYPVFEPVQSLHICALYVAHTHRRKGIGRRLLQAALEWGKQAGCRETDLNVLKDNSAHSLYHSLGFKGTEIRMTRKLD